MDETVRFGGELAGGEFLFADALDPTDLDFNVFLSHMNANEPPHDNPPGFCPTSTSNLRGQSGPSPTETETETETEASSDAHSDPKSACIKKLTNLLLDADNIWAKIPLKSPLHIAKSESLGLCVIGIDQKLAATSMLEMTFIMTQKFIDIYPTAINMAVARDAQSEKVCNITDCIHYIDVVPALLEEEQLGGQVTSGGTDVVVANLIISCHTRLLDILDGLFMLSTSCTRLTVANSREPEFDVSDMRVGSFVPQRTGAVLMQIALLKHLVAGLTERLASFGEAISSIVAGQAQGSSEGQIMELQHQVLTKRHAMKVKQVGVLEEFLFKFDFMK